METKPGYLTTEFWTAIISGVYLALNATSILDQVPESWSAVALAVVTAAYNVSRGIAKQGIKPDGP